MDRLFLIFGIAFVITLVVIFITEIHSKSKDEHTGEPNIRPVTPTHIDFMDVPTVSNHARERMSERLGIDDMNKQNDMSYKAYKYGRTADRADSDLRAKLETVESKYGDIAKAKFFNGAIYIFSKDDHELITVYDYNVNYYIQ